MHSPGIELNGVGLHRAGAPVLRDISLHLTEHRIALVGRNGSGKSTLARLIKGLLRPDTGTIRTYGLNPAQRTRAALSVAGFLFQNSDHQILCPTVGEEIAFGPAEAGAPNPMAEARALMAAHGIAAWEDRAVSTLSEGQRRLVCLLAVLVMAPRVVLLDEPFAGLDIPTRLRLERFIATLPQQVILISHDPEMLMAQDRVIWLEAGAVAADGPPGDVLPAFSAAMRAAADADAADEKPGPWLG